MLAVGPRAGERLADALRVLRGEHHPQHLAAVAAVLENLLPDELSFAVAVGGEPHPPGGAQRLGDGLELRRLVAPRRWLHPVQPVGLEQHRRPTLPAGVHVLGLAQLQQMAFRRKNGAVARPHRGADILRLARLLGDDHLVGHGRPLTGVHPRGVRPAPHRRRAAATRPLPRLSPGGRLRSASGSAS